ncbi:aminotransferase class I/II-fold pyridoxal phosphate-dependent enzyme [Candidatus Woesebacteria bacterium]|nr:aminotransferase class I/II-fold pyridoxal phosphate-dependent enzyme [Candidatus Woesebacteria bacterium]
MLEHNIPHIGDNFYQTLLEYVALGTSDIYGYVNLKDKLGALDADFLRSYRDKIAEKGRHDRFILPDNELNRNLIKGLSKKESWQNTFFPRYIVEKLFDIECDVYVWDDKVGIASFGNDTLTVFVYDDPTLVELFRTQFELIWKTALPDKIFFGPRTSRLTQLENEMYIAGKKFIDLTDGSPHRINPQWVRNIQNNVEGYSVADSEPADLIRDIKNYFIRVSGLSAIELTPTATFAFCLACDTLIDTPGDEIIIADPGFDSYANLIRSFGGNVEYSKRNDDYSINIEHMIEKVTNRTVGMVLIYPDNPFGSVPSEDDLRKLIALCVEKGITLIIDNAFIEVNPFQKIMPKFSDYITDSLSYLVINDTGKILGLRGAKFGGLSYSPNLADKLKLKIPNYFFQFSQIDLLHISRILKHHEFRAYQDTLRWIIKTNYDYLQKNLSSELSILFTGSTSVCLIDISKTGFTDEEFAQSLKENYMVGVVPVSFFYSGQSKIDYTKVRLSLARPQLMIEEAVTRINDCINQLKKQ